MHLLLASNSPRRRELLALTGWTFEIQPADIDETPLPAEAPADYVCRLAQAKARRAAERSTGGQVLLAADTIVVNGGRLLGKPSGPAQARHMLLSLRGRTHQVYTAITLLDPASGRLEADLCVTQVPMRSFSEAELEAYIATGDALDKAGAYAIQHAGFHPVEALQGCFASVMGLPLCHLERTARKMDLSFQADGPAACQAHLGYRCPIYAAVQRGESAG